MKRRLWIGCLLGCAILCLGAAAVSAQGEPEKITVAVAEATIHAGPSAESQVIEKPAVGSVYEVVKKTGDWYEVKLPARLGMTITGFIHVKFLGQAAGEAKEEVAPAAAGAAQATAAKRFYIGIGFLYQRPKGYDYAFSTPFGSTTLGIYDAVDGHNAFGVQAGAGYFITKSFQLDLGFSYSTASPEGMYGVDLPVTPGYTSNVHGEAPVDHEFSEMILSLGVNYHLLSEGNARPYLGIGGSYFSAKMGFIEDFRAVNTGSEAEVSEPVLADTTISTAGFYIKGGLDYLVSESIALFGEARYAIAGEKHVPQPFLSQVEVFKDEVVDVDLGGFSATIGVKFRF